MGVRYHTLRFCHSAIQPLPLDGQAAPSRQGSIVWFWW